MARTVEAPQPVSMEIDDPNRGNIPVAEPQTVLGEVNAPVRGGTSPAEAIAVQASLDDSTVHGFEQLDKWKNCERDVGKCFVYEENRSRAEFNDLPSSMEVGKSMGLTSHEVAALFGWTTGDFRFVNAVARGASQATFEDYPQGVKARCVLSQEDVEPYVQVVSSALQKLPSAGPQRLWRGHRRALPCGGEVGTIVVLPGFTSTSYDRDQAIRFATQFPIPGKSTQRTVLAIEEHESGRNIAKFSARKREAEVLFPRDRRFEVVARADDTGREADEAAVSQAEQEIREQMPEAEVRIVYLKEVADDVPGAFAKEV